jgi:hypothetical protein
MAFKFNVNVTPSDGADAMFRWKEWMKTPTSSGGPGWTVVASSDGYGAGNSTNNTTFTRPDYLSQDFITDTNTLKGFKSWFILRMPGGNLTDGYKEICVQSLAQTYGGNPSVISSWGQFRIKFSPSGFDLTQCSQFQVPPAKTAAARSPANASASHGKKDEIIWGSGTDAGPGAVDVFGPSAFKMHMMANDSDGYGFYFFTTHLGTGRVRNFVMLDPMLTGSCPSEDKQPYVWFGRMYNSSNALSLDNMNASWIQNAPALYYQGAFFNYGNQYETFAGVGAATPSLRDYWQGYLQPLANRIPSNPHTGKDDLFPVMWVKPDQDLWGNNLTGSGTYFADGWPNLAFGYKGISSLLKIVSTNRSTLDTLSVAASGDRIVINDM